MNGALIVDKPAGPTSHDAVAIVRRAIGIRRIGHTGTLDPLATGVLVLLVGRATRLAQFLNTDEKEYVADVRLGVETESGDAEQRTVIDAVTDRAVLRLPSGAPWKPTPPLSSLVRNVGMYTNANVEEALADFRGTYWQTPPSVSAKKIAGTRAYALARRHERVELKPVEVTVRALELISCEHGLVRVRVVCSAGFYVRALARDLGRRLGCGAHLEGLRRTRAGRFGLEDAVRLDLVAEEGTDALDRLMPMNALLDEFPAVPLTEQEAERASHGNALVRADESGAPRDGSWVRLVDGSGTLVAVAERRPGGLLHPVVVLV
jgi:tRNA pseudouridine55 synthase